MNEYDINIHVVILYFGIHRLPPSGYPEDGSNMFLRTVCAAWCHKPLPWKHYYITVYIYTGIHHLEDFIDRTYF
jgi:hypothetical protein